MTEEEIQQLVDDENAEAAESMRIAAEAKAEIAEKMCPLLTRVAEEWREAVATIYPTICWLWESELQRTELMYGDGRGMYFASSGKDWASYFTKEQATELLKQVADPAIRELAYDYLFEHDPTTEVVFCLQDPLTNVIAVFRLPFIDSECV